MVVGDRSVVSGACGNNWGRGVRRKRRERGERSKRRKRRKRGKRGKRRKRRKRRELVRKTSLFLHYC